MATSKQKKIAQLIIENSTLDNPLNGGQIVEKSGYGKSMKLYPKRIIKTKGVEETLEKLGFSEEGAKKVVEEIMYDEKQKGDTRLKATDQVFKVNGSYKSGGEGNQTLIINILPEIKQRYDAIPPSTEDNSPRQA